MRLEKLLLRIRIINFDGKIKAKLSASGLLWPAATDLLWFRSPSLHSKTKLLCCCFPSVSIFIEGKSLVVIAASNAEIL